MLTQQYFYLVGIKGVAMTAMACCLSDLGKNITGSDVAEDFPTKKTLDQLSLQINQGFNHSLPAHTQVVIYSGANGGSLNPQVVKAKEQGLLVYSHAQALGMLFAQKKGIAICGVGGKSTISGMLAFLTAKTEPQSYSVGVGEIIGLQKTGFFSPTSQYFIAEADEYIEDPASYVAGEPIVPRFSYLHPQITICTSLRYDHPDVYQDFNHTKKIYYDFFSQIKPNGTLIINGDDDELLTLAKKLLNSRTDIKLISYGEQAHNDYQLSVRSIPLNLPGKFNQLNALAAYACGELIGLSAKKMLEIFTLYRSVKRRFEYLGNYQGIECWDDYAHHPAEIASAIDAIQQWYPNRRVVVAFQSHTFSRTKQLFKQFIQAFAHCSHLVMIDIFPSAREKWDDSINSTLLCDAINNQFPHLQAKNLHTLANLKTYLQTELQSGDIFLTLGAGDIYQVYQDIFNL